MTPPAPLTMAVGHSTDVTKGLETIKILLNTGASFMLMPSWQAQKLQLEVKPWTDIVVRGIDGWPLAIEGVTE